MTNQEELIIKRLPNNQIQIEIAGENLDIAYMLCHAMIENVEIASIVCAAIPTFLDKKGIDRREYCNTVINAVGSKSK
jgi:hypothetical protein